MSLNFRWTTEILLFASSKRRGFQLCCFGSSVWKTCYRWSSK